MKNPEVFVGIPSGTEWKADFGMSLAGLVASAARPLKNGGRVNRLQLWNTKGSILPRSRDTLARKAIELECSHLLFLDSDMTFPNWTLHQLLSHGKQVVAANCATKMIPATPTARQFEEGNRAGSMVYTREQNGLEKVWRVGTGVMLIEVAVFKGLPTPWFPISWEEDKLDYTGEDWNFCQVLQDKGIPIFIDHTLSRSIGHLGQYEYTHAEVGGQEEG